MMQINWIILLVAALVPLLVGWLWYSNMLFGKAFANAIKANGQENMKKHSPVTYLMTFFLSFLVAMLLQSIVIHQFGVYSLLMDQPGMGDPNSEISIWLNEFMSTHGKNFRTFKHGVLHGVMTGLFIATPVIAINGMFENKKRKMILIDSGYWTVTLGIMGGILCAFI